MPTTRPRLQVTETPDVERALGLAARRWPGIARSELATRLMTTGADALSATDDAERDQYRQLLHESAGSLDAAYPKDYLRTMRQDWDE